MTNLINKALLVLIFLVTAISTLASQSLLCEKNQRNQLSFAHLLKIRASDEFTLITWNAQKLNDTNFMPDLVQLSQESDLILIQEAMHNTDLQNTFSSKFDFSFSFNKSFCDSKNQATGVMSASRYLLENNVTLVSPDNEPFTATPKVSGYSTVEIPEIGKVHIINTHGLNFNTGSKFERQISHLSEFISQLKGPVIWAGDFNTWSSGRKNHLDIKTKALGLVQLIPSNDNRNLKLDHIYTRGLKLISVELLLNIKSSDHLPLKAIFKKARATDSVAMEQQNY